MPAPSQARWLRSRGNGKVAYLRAVGFRDHAKTTLLQPDAIFWIASMTKPVTSVAAMMLVEELSLIHI